MLTPEERQRIEEEERKRIAEAQYRAEIRARLLQAEPKAQPTLVQKPSQIHWVLALGAILIVGVILLAYDLSQPKAESEGGTPVAITSSPFAKTRYVPATKKIATGPVIVKAQGYVQYQFVITPEMVEPTVTGSFTASGGSGNDIAAVIADEMNYTNWINGHQSSAFWSTQGKETTGSFELRLKPGVYYLAFSNRFSSFTDKEVVVEADLNYKKSETYH